MKFFWPLTPISVVGGATEATALLQLAELEDINSNTADVSTEAKQDVQITAAASTNTKLDTLIAKDYATQTTLAALNAKVTAVNTGAVTISAALPAGNNNIGDVDIASSVLPTGAATEASLASAASSLSDLNARVAGSLVPETFDYQSIAYIGATTDIDTVTFKSGGSGGATVAVLTMGYDGSNRLTSVTRS